MMDDLFTHFQSTFVGDDEFKLFAEFFDNKLYRRLVTEWLKYRFKKDVNVKSDCQSEDLRKQGNELYSQKHWSQSIECYTKALCKAQYDCEIYGLALANRSAVFFTLKDYNSCLKDILLCKKTKYPNRLRGKIYIRQLESYYELGLSREFEEAMRDAICFLETTEQVNNSEKEKCRKKISALNKTFPKNSQVNVEKLCELPLLKGGENERFAYASNSIRLSYDSARGRHIRANETLRRGDVIFVEKAFMFTPIYTSSFEISLKKCYNCLADVTSCVPCMTCIVCVYCDETCRDASWNDMHRWECTGFTLNLWYDLGIALPAFRALVKGEKCGFKRLEHPDEDDVQKFGDKTENYPYFNKLVTNIAKLSNVTPLLVSSAVTVLYLEAQTDFFGWLIKQKNTPVQNMSSLLKLVGGLLTRHIAQLSCNSSIVQHWTKKANEDVPSECIQVACGIYPSSSMMNHSCRANVSTIFLKDVVIVKAVDTISENAEILNCYGVDHRFMSKPDRQHALRTLYDFTCRCEICQNPLLEFCRYNGYKCPECGTHLPEILYDEYRCVVCGCRKPSSYFQNLEEQARQHLDTGCHRAKNVNKCFQIRRKILGNFHADLDECFEFFFLCYLRNGDLQNCMSAFKQSLRLQQKRLGRNSRVVGNKMFDSVMSVISRVKDMQISNAPKWRNLVHELENLVQESKDILHLYYMSYQVDYGEIERNLSHIKQLISK